MILINRFTVIINIILFFVIPISFIYSYLNYYILGFFLSLRFPILWGSLGLLEIIIFIVFPLFLSLIFNRIENGLNIFFSSFIPIGTPLWIAWFVGLAETISYMVRPLILVIRPFLNISIGVLGTSMVINLIINSFSLIIFSLLFIIFFYEIFVAIVHWYIVNNILNFSINH
uniref:ATP synthase F0 subunit 6 n=1 Tax=Paratetraonchoides inermis TaxID=2048240 RepID=A0A2D1GRT1_9PLAT|nr:ATP synthase F0 subunit 6 [Paratetraonchoides inermis]ATN95413.1 ATP synthase F0 subunit 6 [Paratetraonchoides inermis]